MSENIRILVACHKPCSLPQDDIYLPIQVGADLTTVDLGIQKDNEGYNISSKNESYCELTAMYWAWKNLKNVDVIGLCHYRRYFDFHKQCRAYFPHTSYSYIEDVDLRISQCAVNEYIMKICGGGVIVPKAITLNSTLKQNYCEYHISDDYQKLKEIVERTQETKYIDAFDSVLEKDYKIYPYNMFVMQWEDFDAYCSWLFPLLSNVEYTIDIRDYHAYQRRIYGFMAERLFNVWLFAERKRIIEKPIIFFNDEDARNRTMGPRKLIRQWSQDIRCKWINRLYIKTMQ